MFSEKLEKGWRGVRLESQLLDRLRQDDCKFSVARWKVGQPGQFGETVSAQKDPQAEHVG